MSSHLCLYSPVLVKTKEDSKTTVCLPDRLDDKRKCWVGSEVITFWFQWNLDCGRRAEDVQFGQVCEFRNTNRTFCVQRCRNSKHRIRVWGVQFQDENYALAMHNDNSHKHQISTMHNLSKKVYIQRGGSTCTHSHPHLSQAWCRNQSAPEGLSWSDPSHAYGLSIKHRGSILKAFVIVVFLTFLQKYLVACVK